MEIIPECTYLSKVICVALSYSVEIYISFLALYKHHQFLYRIVLEKCRCQSSFFYYNSEVYARAKPSPFRSSESMSPGVPRRIN